MTEKMRGRRAGALWHDAARAVTGRDNVEIRWATPEMVHATGEAADGECLIFQSRPLIRLRPGMSAARKWHVFTHEVAHVCLGHVDDLEDMGGVDFGAASLSVDENYSHDYGFRERQTDHYASIVLDWPVSRRVGQDASLRVKLRALCAEWQRGAGRR